MRNCASGNLEIPGSMLADRLGMTKQNEKSLPSFTTAGLFRRAAGSAAVTPRNAYWT
jgi:hypothetical protein